jgi:ArsR family transcriptional regulator
MESVKRKFSPPGRKSLAWIDAATGNAISLKNDMPLGILNSENCCSLDSEQPERTALGLEGPEADEELARLTKALGHPARVRILRILSRKEARVCSQIVDELPLAQSTVSEHLRILKEAGLVRSSQDGPRVGYCINFDGLRRLRALVAII